MWKTAVGGPTTSERRGLRLFHVDIRFMLIMNSAPGAACTYAILCLLPTTLFKNLLGLGT